jgi:hypothetical protein
VSGVMVVGFGANLRGQISYAKCHIEWARKNLETWSEASEEVDKIVAR